MIKLINGLEVAVEISRNKNGLCLSNIYVNNHTKMKWQCQFGHIWLATLNKIKDANEWCPYCTDKIQLKLQDLKDFANAKNGKCLAETYVNNRERVLWECNEGHTWYATFNNIKNGKYWCPYCSR